MSATATHIVGIDLGTSNCAVAFARVTESSAPTVSDFPIPQLQRPGQVAAQPLLPSCLYIPGEHELPAGSTTLPWDQSPSAAETVVTPPSRSTNGDTTSVSSGLMIVGEFARWQGSRVPGRLVASAKSWLCHPGVDRTAAILPWGAPADVPKVSPMHASGLLLSHLAKAWNAAHPHAPLADQEVVITVPASFDEVARALTVSSAREAGLEKFTLVEEPQAAFYDFTSRHRADLADALAGVRLVLVVDVGGGTTDFTLISVAVGEDGPVLKRIAVGEHLMLGGDNMDAALARRAEERLVAAGHKLNATQWTQLVQASRNAKESLLSLAPSERHAIAIAGGGSRLIGSTLSTELTREEVEQLIVDGFFPICTPDEQPRRSARTALQELGLPYAQDPAITRHLAAFLSRHAASGFAAISNTKSEISNAAIGGLPRPDAILLNGGVFNSSRLANRLVDVVSGWWPDSPRIQLLHHDSLDLAVARGAAAYGLARRGLGRRIGGGAAQALYIGLTTEAENVRARGVCVIPRGHEEGQTADITERPFKLIVGQPVQFPLFSTTSDRVDKAGDIIDVTDEFRPLQPLHTLLRATQAKGGTVLVHLRATLTELGTLELWCVSDAADERWRVEFELRGAVARASSTVIESMPASFGQVRELVDRVYGPASRTVDPREVKQLGQTLEAALGPRESWRLPLLRELWSTLFSGAKRRRRSAVHERIFYRFVGYGLRPGFGYPLDEWRCEQTFQLLPENVNFRGETSVWNEFWVMWRRISGGLTEEHHRALWRYLEPHLARRVPPSAAKNASKPKGVQPEGLDEMVRAAASLEHLDLAEKAVFGNWIAARLRSPQSPAGPWAWALGRIGSRVPIYGSNHKTVAPEIAAEWLTLLLDKDLRTIDGAAFAAVQLARVTGDRTRDLDPEIRARTLRALQSAKGPERWLRLVNEVVPLDADDQSRALGDTLPIGLTMH